ncbi:MAG TPA: hypothetical protein VGC32_20405 [Solirubrobacterales bacterium]
MVTVLAFVVLAGGTAYAASEMLPKNSVGTKQLAKEAVTPAKLSQAAKKTLIGPAGPVGAQGATGPKGDTGSKGDRGEVGLTGAAGSAKAWAEISSTGVVVRSSPGLTVIHKSAGEDCVNPGDGFNNTNSVAVATINNSDPATSSLFTMDISNTSAFNTCPAGDFDVFGIEQKGTTTAPAATGYIIAFI